MRGPTTLESLPVIYSRKALGLLQTPNPAPPENHIELLKDSVKEMLKQDAKNIDAGIYPASLLMPENPLAHLQRYRHVLIDSFRK